MTSKTSSSKQTAPKKLAGSGKFSISAALIKEDFRRFWAIPAIAFIGYFLTGIFYILVNYDAVTDNRGSYMAGFIETMLEGSYWAFIINMLWVPLLSSVLVFRYMHKTGHVMTAHSQPFSRSTILNSHTASCALFCILPILATALVLLVIAKPVYYPADTYTSTETIVNIFSRLRIINWAWDTILVSMFILVICIIGGLATGTSFHHAVAAGGFNIVLPVSLFFIISYCDVYLFGFTDSNFIEELIAHSHLAVLNAYDDFLSIGQNIAYIIVIAALYALCHFMYKKRKLERATDGVVFKAFDLGITLVFGYLGMTLLGLAFHSIFEESAAITTVGYVVGALLGMIICRMIIMKSIKVFNRNTFKMLAAYLVVAVLFIGCMGLDITGFERRVPDDADCVSIELDSDLLGITDYYAMGGTYTDRETVDAVKALHQLIVDNKADIESVYKDERNMPDDTMWFIDEQMAHVYLTYYEGTDKEAVSIMRRSYSVPVYMLIDSPELEALIQSKEFRERVESYIPEPEDIVNMDIHGGEYTNGADTGISLTDQTQIAGFIDAYLKDVRAMDLDHIKSVYNKTNVAFVNISYRDPNNQRHMKEPSPSEIAEITGDYGSVTTQALTDYGYYSSVDLEVTYAHKNTIQWLIDNGYSELIRFDDESFDFMVIHKVEGGVNGSEKYPEMPASDDEIKVVTDKTKIQSCYIESRAHEVFDSFENISTSEDDIYCVMFYSKNYDGSGQIDGYHYSYAAFIQGEYL